MNALFRARTIEEIADSRQQKRRKKVCIQKANVSLEQQPTHEQRIQSLTRKTALNNEDKITVLRYLERKYRLRFNIVFATSLLTWVCERQKKIIDKHYDSNKRSYFLLRGKLSLCERSGGLRETRCRQDKSRYEQVLLLQGEAALGEVFDPQVKYHRSVLVAENALILQIDHPQDELSKLERNCLMTNEQKEIAVKMFPLFKNLDNVNRYHTPYFPTRLYSKGEIIYNIGDSAQHLFLIVQGEVQFQSKIPMENPEVENVDVSIASLTLRNSFQRYLTIGTEAITAGNFFGEQELLSQTSRHQIARCLSLTALLILVPLDRFDKLLHHNEFRDMLTSAAKDRIDQRMHTISAMTALQPLKKQSTQSEKFHVSLVNFAQLNQKIYKSRSEKKQTSRNKFSLPNRRSKLVHGNQIQVPAKCKQKTQTFSMLQVNKSQYQKSMKKFKLYDMEEKKRKKQMTMPTNQPPQKQSCARTLRQIWQVLKLEQILQDQGQKMHLQNRQGKVFYHAHMRILKHLGDMKSYRPKTIGSNCRVKTEYVEYLQNAI